MKYEIGLCRGSDGPKHWSFWYVQRTDDLLGVDFLHADGSWRRRPKVWNKSGNYGQFALREEVFAAFAKFVINREDGDAL